MNSNDNRRWVQRFGNYRKALARLEEACGIEDYSDIERAGLIQTFEFTFELAWKTLKDLLDYEGFDAKSPRTTLRTAFQAQYMSEEDAEALLDALDKRSFLSHAYQEKAALEAEALTKTRYYPVLVRLADMLRSKSSS